MRDRVGAGPKGRRAMHPLTRHMLSSAARNLCIRRSRLRAACTEEGRGRGESILSVSLGCFRQFLATINHLPQF